MLHVFINELNSVSGKKKVDVLKKYEKDLYIRDFFFLYVKKPSWLMPEGAPPYEKLNIDQEKPAPLNRITKQIPKFISGHGDHVKAYKREQLFIRFLESIHPEDAEQYLQLKEGTLKLKGLKKEHIIEVFPHLA